MFEKLNFSPFMGDIKNMFIAINKIVNNMMNFFLLFVFYSPLLRVIFYFDLNVLVIIKIKINNMDIFIYIIK